MRFIELAALQSYLDRSVGRSNQQRLQEQQGRGDVYTEDVQVRCGSGSSSSCCCSGVNTSSSVVIVVSMYIDVCKVYVKYMVYSLSCFFLYMTDCV